MNDNERMSFWIELFLAYKYMNEFLKHSLPKSMSINSFDYFILLALRDFENLTFYEINKALPIDVKSLHNKINGLIEKGLLEREFLENGSSFINLKNETKIMAKDIRENLREISKDYYEASEVKELSKSLQDFNEKMRIILDFKIKDETLNKLKKNVIS